MDSGSMASALQHKGMKTGHSVPCLLLIMGPGAAPEMQRGWRGTPGSDWRSSSAGKATRWSWGQGHSVLLLLPAPGKWQLGFWSLCILLFMICPSCTSRQVFVVPCSLFVFCSWGWLAFDRAGNNNSAPWHGSGQNTVGCKIPSGPLPHLLDPSSKAMPGYTHSCSPPARWS